MKFPTLITIICLSACNGNEQKTVSTQDSVKTVIQSPPPVNEKTGTDSIVKKETEPVRKVYANARFKDVTVAHLGGKKEKRKFHFAPGII